MYDIILEDHPQIYAFTRTLEDQRLLVLLNWSGTDAVFELPEGIFTRKPELLIANYPVDEHEDTRPVGLRPWEARVFRMDV